MSDNQSWNSSGSEEDIEPLEEPGHPVGIADLSGVLSKVSHIWQNGQSVLPTRRGRNLFPQLGYMRQPGVIYDRSKHAEYGRLHIQKLSSDMETLRNKRGWKCCMSCVRYSHTVILCRFGECVKMNEMKPNDCVLISHLCCALICNGSCPWQHLHIFLSVGNGSNSVDYSRQSCYQAFLDQLDTKG